MMSISGLASGLDSAGIVDQLMQLEALSQKRLETRVSAQNAVIAALRQVNTRSSTLGSAAEALAKPEAWQTLKGTSTNTAVSVTATAAASPGTLSFTVTSLATAPKSVHPTAAKLAADVVSATDNKLTLTVDGSALAPIATDGTLQDAAAKINAAGAGVTATLIKVGESGGSGDYRLVLSGDKTGAASTFSVAGLDTTVLGTATPTAGTDAKLDLGNGIVASSATSTFTGLTPGVSVTLGAAVKVGDAATTTVARDTSSIASSVKGLVDKVNDLITHLDGATSSGASGAKGALAGDSASRALRSALINTVFGSDDRSLADVGIQTDKYGKLVFDEAKFKEAYAADPAGTAARFTSSPVKGAEGGWAARVAAVTEATYGPEGIITTAITGREKSVERLKDSIADWDVRLDLRRKALTRTFTALEVAMSNMNGQSSWLAGQIASLPKNSA